MISELPIARISIGLRHRRDLGDVAVLADSIRDLGLLQPIGIDADNRLIFGHRRLEACRSLGWTSIPVRVIDAPALLAEHDENEIRKDFTHSERVAIGKEVEAFLGDRRKFNADGGPRHTGTIQENFPESKAGQQTRDVAAKVAGFGNGKTYQQAKQVVEKGTPELVQAMDTGDVFISAAATLATLPPQEQTSALSSGREATLERVRQAREAKAAEVVSLANRIKRERKDVSRAARESEAALAAESVPAISDRYRIIHGGCEQALSLDAGSVDWIVTDPPYPKEHLPLFDALGEIAAHVLRPGGALLVMVGQFHLPEIIRKLEMHLSYHWTMAYLTPGGQSPQIFPRRVNTFWKPVICFAKGEYAGPWIGEPTGAKAIISCREDWGSVWEHLGLVPLRREIAMWIGRQHPA
ncbi:MAG: ParB N-terminal domain-containing protein [Magnetococcales bacterium]|nr:ParB N-terminal domain-containing protein [Magnetococcales bacterium]